MSTLKRIVARLTITAAQSKDLEDLKAERDGIKDEIYRSRNEGDYKMVSVLEEELDAIEEQIRNYAKAGMEQAANKGTWYLQKATQLTKSSYKPSALAAEVETGFLYAITSTSPMGKKKSVFVYEDSASSLKVGDTGKVKEDKAVIENIFTFRKGVAKGKNDVASDESRPVYSFD